MLNALIRLALRNRGVVLVLCVVVLAGGGYLATTLPIDVFPDLDRPRVVLLAEAPGLSPEEVEVLAAVPLETALLGTAGVTAVRGQASQGLAVITIEFDWSVPPRQARQAVTERLASVDLPPGVRVLMTPPAALMGQVLLAGLTWKPDAPGRQGKTEAEDRMDLGALAEWVVRPRLLRIPGVAEVLTLGGDRKRYEVRVDPDKLTEYDVSLQEVEAALRANNRNASGGILEDGLTERPVRVLGRLGPAPEQVVAELLQVPVKVNGPRAVLLSHVARVEEAPAPKRGDGGVNGMAGVVVTVVKQSHADTRHLTEQIEAALREIEAALPGVAVNADLFQLRRFIDRGVYYVEEALLLGAALVVVILFLFLLNLRTTFITLTAIPLSLVITTLVFRAVGWLTTTELSINVMTLGGIAVAMGELVDDAIVDVENIYRRLGENAASENPRSSLVVVYEASKEIRSAIVYGTAVVVLAFVPLFALTGVEGRLFAPLGVAYIVSILASLVVSLTVTPVLSYYLLGNARSARHNGDGPLLRLLKWLAGFLIRFSLRRAGVLLLVTWVLVGVSAWMLTRLGADFLPKFDEGSVQLNVALPGGSSLRASNETAARIDARLNRLLKSPTNPDGPILAYARRTGRAERDEHVEPVTRSEYVLTMNPDAHYQRDEFLRDLLADLRKHVPGAEMDAEQPLSHLISHMLSGVPAQIAIIVHGDDLGQLRRIAERVRDVVATVPGATPPLVDPQERVDEVHVVLRPADLAYHCLSRDYVADFVQAALKGEAVSEILDGQRRHDLVVLLTEPVRSDPTRLGDLRLDLPDGRGRIRLKDVADFPEAASGPNFVNRQDGRRKQVVRCNVSGRDVGSTATDIERRVRAEVPLPAGYFVEFGGQFEAQRSATLLIGVLSVVSLGGIFVVLMSLYPSVRVSLQILNAVPAAFIGGVLALVLTGQTLTVASLVGFVSLGGIAVRNGILLVTHYFHLMKHEGEDFTPAMVLRGSLERLSPVLMTALTAGIALVPLVLGGRKPGLEILYPVATVIVGGLVTSTLCEFLLHPGLFWRFSGRDAERLVRDDAEEAL